MLLAAWVLFVGFYLLMAGQLAAAELSAGAIIAAATVCFVLLCRRGEERGFRFRAPWVRLAGRVSVALVLDSMRVGGVLLRALIRRPVGTVGVVRRLPFHHGGDRPHAAARRALVTLAASIAPNGYVLELPEDEDALPIHRLAPAPPPQDRDWPV
jgi:hypothetical protein